MTNQSSIIKNNPVVCSTQKPLIIPPISIHIFIIGRGVGSLIGGFLSKEYGLRNTFQTMGVICGITCTTYFILNMFWLKNKVKQRKIKRMKEKKNKVAKEGKQEDKNTDNTEEKTQTKKIYSEL